MTGRGKMMADETSNLPRLRQRFLVWGVAIASSLSTTGLVTLRPAAAWAQEDATADEKQTEEVKKFNPTDFTKLLREQKVAEAVEMFESAKAADPENPMFDSLAITLAMYEIRVDKTSGLARLQELYNKMMDKESLSASQANVMYSCVSYLTQMQEDMSDDDKLEIIDATLTKLESQKNAESGMTNLLQLKSRLLMAAGKTDEAKALFDGMLTAARASVSEDNASSMQKFIAAASTYASALGGEFPEAASSATAEAETIAEKLLDAEDAGVTAFATYYNLMNATASRLTYTDPQAAASILEKLQAKLDSFSERLDESEKVGVERYSRSIASSMSRIETALKREKLVGSVAPDFDPAHFVAMEETTMDDLKGKVVLVDFWAVWCGPCIATFPHLRDWHEEFSDDGLVIVGVTNFYGYSWDEEAGKASRGADEVSAEDELAMLEKFRDSYDLKHGFIVSKKGSDYASQFAVSGIPQAVLIDKEGKIRMIRVGSGEANAKALEELIKELLAS